jgi:hypothetical protein
VLFHFNDKFLRLKKFRKRMLIKIRWHFANKKRPLNYVKADLNEKKEKDVLNSVYLSLISFDDCHSP